MKKTLITILALAGTAAAATQQYDFSADVVRTTTTETEGTKTSVIATFGADSPVGAIYFLNCRDADDDSISVGYLNTNASTHPNTFTPNYNVGDGKSWAVDLQFMAGTSLTSSAVEISSVTFSVFAFNSGGAAQSTTDNKLRAITFNLYNYYDAVTSDVTFTQSGGDSAWERVYTVTLDTPLVVSSRGNAMLRLEAIEDNSQGTYIGISNISYTLVPEPATATLSLLALAGLAARRRRK